MSNAPKLPNRIVAEISKSWPAPGAPSISKSFELVIEQNEKRGYELESWQLSRVVVHDAPIAQAMGINETIIAVFKNSSRKGAQRPQRNKNRQ
jgi:hypothetical protein